MKFKNKHLEPSLFSPSTRISDKIRSLKLPYKWIITYDFTEIDSWILKNYKAKKIKISRSFTIYISRDIGFIKLHGFGSSYSVMVLEELIEFHLIISE